MFEMKDFKWPIARKKAIVKMTRTGAAKRTVGSSPSLSFDEKEGVVSKKALLLVEESESVRKKGVGGNEEVEEALLLIEEE